MKNDRSTADRHRAERGASMMELIVASTVFVLVIASTFTSTSSFSRTLNDQVTIQEQFTNSNVTRMRILGDADSSTSASCPAADQLDITVGAAPSTLVSYSVVDGKLSRYSNPPDHASVVAESAESLTCADLGTDGIYIGIDLGTSDLPYHLHLRISSGVGGA